jgi:hypothetical protein
MSKKENSKKETKLVKEQEKKKAPVKAKIAKKNVSPPPNEDIVSQKVEKKTKAIQKKKI